MAQEIEAKIKVEALEPTAQRLTELGARFSAVQHQHDVYFHDADGLLKKRGCGLRLREETVNGKSVFILTFKGPRQDSPFKSRPEFQTQVSDSAEMIKILEGLGYQPVLTVEKKRSLWQMDGCDICLDEVEMLGPFVEIEGPNEESIRRILNKLGLQNKLHLSQSYSSM
ncbi:MAG TPA: class IV adenylate cyclase, partial [Anaerohalosphaeraceae bacterium]|nr:class IV adenylate cyclase [Anaerohalosphaeraceae bacterium]